MIGRLLVLAIIGISLMSPRSAIAKRPPVPDEVAEDMERAETRINELKDGVGSDLPWQEARFPELACLSSHGPIRGYQASYGLSIRATDADGPLDVEAIFQAARVWLTNNGYEIVEDTIWESGKWEILAINDDDELGIAVQGYDQIIGMDATTKCRDV